MLRIGWFATARTLGGSSAKLLAAALKAIEGGLDARIEFVFSNRDPGEFESSDRFFDLVRAAGLPLITLSNTKFRRKLGGDVSRGGEPLPGWRNDYDAAIAGLLSQHGWDIGILAGYMLIFTGAVCERWPLINLHPAAPGGPIGTWQNVIWELIGAGANDSGVQWQLATTNLDRGPIVSFCRYSLRGGDLDELWAERGSRPLDELRAEGEANPLFQAIRARGAARELPLLVETLRALTAGEVQVLGGGTAPYVVAGPDGLPLEGYDLTEAVESAIFNRETP